MALRTERLFRRGARQGVNFAHWDTETIDNYKSFYKLSKMNYQDKVPSPPVVCLSWLGTSPSEACPPRVEGRARDRACPPHLTLTPAADGRSTRRRRWRATLR